METYLKEPYLYAFGDLSPFRGQEVTLTISLLHPHVCAKKNCTHDVELLIGPLQFQKLPDICTTEPDGTHKLYDYLADPTVNTVKSCAAPQPFYFIDLQASAGHKPGAGRDHYNVDVKLPARYRLLDYSFHFGPICERLRINLRDWPPATIHQNFPIRRGTYNRIAPAARYSFVNRNPKAMARRFRPGTNRMEIQIATSKSYAERPFSLFARFLAYHNSKQDKETSQGERK